MNKQNIIDDYKQTIERLQKECAEKTDFNIKLMERVKELEQKLNAQFAEMEEKLTAEENKNFELKEKNIKLEDKLIIANSKHVDYIIETNEKIVKLRKKLKIAEEALNDIKNSFYEGVDKEITALVESIYYYRKAQKSLQKMKEITNDNNINLN